MAKVMKLMIDGIVYTATVPENTVTDMLGFQGPIELQLRRYADLEYYAPLKNSAAVFQYSVGVNRPCGRALLL